MEFQLERDVSILARTPAVLRALLAELPREWTHARYGEGTWSAHEVVGHLIHGEQTDWIPRVRHLLELGESKPFEPFDRRGHESLCASKSLPELLDLFEKIRRENIAALRSLPLSHELLSRRGRHPAFGPVTLGQLLATWVVHDLNHIAQICKAMAYQHRDAVGPWEQYLSILAPPAPR
jgi:uncharacterized damage-inducible protein DinB